MSTIKERVDAISENVNLSLSTPQTTAKIEISGFCSLDCKFCYHKQMKKKSERQKFMSDQEFEIVLEHMKEFYPNIKEVGLFYMGESGLHPHIDKFYKRLKREGYFTYLTTNGTYIQNIIRSIPYIDSLKVSWNYKDLKDFEEKTGSGIATYEQIKNNIRVLKEICNAYHKQLTVSTVLDSSRQDYEEVLKTLCYDEHYWIPLQTQGGTFEEGSAGVIGEDDNRVSPIPCWSLFKGLYIDADLNVRACCYGHTKDHIIYHIGDDIKELTDVKIQHLKGNIPKICKQCLG